MAVFVLQVHIINKHVYFRSINGLKALVYDIVLFKCEFWFLRSPTVMTLLRRRRPRARALKHNNLIHYVLIFQSDLYFLSII